MKKFHSSVTYFRSSTPICGSRENKINQSEVAQKTKRFTESTIDSSLPETNAGVISLMDEPVCQKISGGAFGLLRSIDSCS